MLFRWQERRDALAERHDLIVIGRQDFGVSPHVRHSRSDRVAQFGSRGEVVLDKERSTALAAEVDELIGIVDRVAGGAAEMETESTHCAELPPHPAFGHLLP